MKIEIKMTLTGTDEDEGTMWEVVVAKIEANIEVTKDDDEETLMDKVYEEVQRWYEKTGNVGCEAEFELDEILKKL